MPDYPEEAYAPDGTLWWELDYWPGTRRDFGVERKLATWLTFNPRIGQVLTMRELRAALGGAAPNDDEHFNRRLRSLRQAVATPMRSSAGQSAVALRGTHMVASRS